MGAEPQGPRPGRLSPRSLYGSCTALAASAPSIFRMESRSHTSVAKAANPIQLSSVPPPPRHPFRRTRTDSAAVIGAASAVASERSLLAVKPPSGQAVSGILAASTDGVAGSAAPHAMPLDVGVQSQQGKSPYKNVNQDRWTAVRADGIELYGVFDGHGVNGHRVASYVSDRLGKELLALIGAPSSHEEAAAATSALREAHHRTERALEASAVDCTAAGCTGVCIVLLRPSPSQGPDGEDVTGGSGGTHQGAASRPENAAVTMLVSNVGDSRAVLGSSVPRRGQFGAAQLKSSGLDPRDSRALAEPTHSPSTARPTDLTTDHKPDHPAERLRIEAAGGVVAKSLGAGALGPFRVWDPQMRVGLATSRAFGDTNAKAVTHDPDIRGEVVISGDHFVILGSDGLWDRISSAEAVKMAAAAIQRGAQHAAEILAAESLRRWHCLGPMSDDITVMVVRLPQP